jgi:hypothetical protein
MSVERQGKLPLAPFPYRGNPPFEKYDTVEAPSRQKENNDNKNGSSQKQKNKQRWKYKNLTPSN